jgi:DNA-binding FadR family transcriptional regulator
MTVGHLSVGGPRARAVKASERVAHAIVADIVARGLASGDRLPLEAAMVQYYQVSRTTVREALRLLEVEGLITLKPGPGGGPAVGTVEPTHLSRTSSLYFHLGAATYREAMQTQVMMEASCARLAASSPHRVEAMAPWLDTELPEEEAEYRKVSYGFHRTVYDLTDNKVLSLLTQSVTHLVTDHVISTMDPVDLRGAIIDEHRDLAEVIAAGDGERAAATMAAHFEHQHAHLETISPARLDDYVQWK